nr:ATP-dependent helicase [Propionibacterium sp.]
MMTPDPSQQRVLDHRGRPLLVLGAAGTGKTALLVELVARRLRAGAAPALALCLTRQAASEVRDRVIRASGRTSLQPAALTLHALCLALLTRHGDPEDAAPRLLTAPEQEFRLRELLAGRGAGLWPESLAAAFGTRAFARQARAALARARQLGFDPDDLAAAGAAAAEPAWLSLGVFMGEYLDVLDAEGVLDYAELVHRTRILLGRPEVLDAVRGEFGAVYVDEYAELDPAQLALVRSLVPAPALGAEPGPAFVAFADPDTAIYRFRGAHPRGVGDFERLFGGEVATLGVRHRGPAAIGGAARGVAARLPGPAVGAAVLAAYRDPVAAPGRGLVEVVTFPDEAAQTRHIAAELRAAHLEGGVPWADMAVLVRAGRQQIPALSRALTDAAIPVEVAGDEIGLADELAVRPLLLALELAARDGGADAEEAVRLLTSGWGGLDALALRVLGRLLRSDAAARGESTAGRTAGDLIADALNGGPLPEPDDAVEVLSLLAERRAVLARARAAVAAGRRPDEVLWVLWGGTPWPAALRAAALAGGDAAPAADRDLDAVVALFDLARASQAPAGVGGVRAFLAEVAAQEIPADLERESAVRGRGVRLLTAHRAKGRQWRFVVVAGAQEGVWPDVRRRGSLFDPQRLTSAGLGPGVTTRDLVANERRLFLLAVTRASERLLVTAVAGTEGEADQPSRFLGELGVPARHVLRAEPRLHTLRALVAALRRAAVDETRSAELRAAAVTRLARLASAVDDEGRPLVPDADPERWWGVRAPTSLEAPRGGDAPVVLSPSQLASVLQCPRQYFLAREARAEPPRSSSALLGTVIHALAQHALVEGLTAENALEYLDRVWEGIPFPAPWFSASERVAAEQAVNRFMGWQEANDSAEVVGVEVPFTATVDVAGEPVTLVGTVDRLERAADGRLRVVDFKSGRTAPTVAEAAASEQLGAYQVAIEAGAFGPCAGSGGGQLVYLRLGDDDYPKVFTQPSLADCPHLTDDPEERAFPTWVHHRLARACATIRAGRFDATPGGHCQRCAFAGSCPARSGQVIA